MRVSLATWSTPPGRQPVPRERFRPAAAAARCLQRRARRCASRQPDAGPRALFRWGVV